MECTELVRRVFETEEAPYELLPEDESLKKETALNYHLDTVNRILEVRVDSVGQDFAESFAALEGQEIMDMAEVNIIRLNMNDPGCPHAYRFCRERGYIFTGCLPGGSDADYLLLQHLKGERIVEEKMVLEPNYREMMDLVLDLIR